MNGGDDIAVPDALVGEKVRLRPAREDDVERIWAGQDWDGLRLGAGGPPVPFSRKATEEWLLAETSGSGGVHFIIDPLQAGAPIAGRINLVAVEFPQAVAMLGMGLLPDSRRQGYGIDALRVLCAFAFEQLNLHKITLGTWEFNTGAQALYRKVGFVDEGREREWLFRDGRYWDSIAMGLLRTEWQVHRGRPGAASA